MLQDKEPDYTISRLARDCEVPPSTIRFYILKGLLKPIGKTKAGYQIFDKGLSKIRVKRIKELSKRMSIEEVIKEIMSMEGL
jgi:DNA-binding transcriptional MerR regulator